MTKARKTGKTFIDGQIAPIKFFPKNFSPAKCANPENAKAAQALGFRGLRSVWAQLWGRRGYACAFVRRQELDNFFFSISRNLGKTFFDAILPSKKFYWRQIHGEKTFSGFPGSA